MRIWKFLSRVGQPVIRTDAELRSFVLRVWSACTAIAVAVDVINQLLFFVTWTEALRSWAITAALATVIALPVSRAVAKAHLALFRSKAEFEKRSRTDELTGLLNRRAIMEYAVTAPPETMVLVIADIDRFKAVNDDHGHLTGDTVIRLVSDIAQEELGDLGHLGRVGGEEFALLATGVSPGLVLYRLEKLRARIALTPAIAAHGTAVYVTISAGAALRGRDAPFDQLYADADRALYKAKTAGRDRIACSELFAAACENEAPRDAGPPVAAAAGRTSAA